MAHIKIKNAEDQQYVAGQGIQKELTTGGDAIIEDSRPKSLIQRKQQQNMGRGENPIQRIPRVSARFQRIASTMGEKYGVDTSSLHPTHNSSFPAKLNAEATIQGSEIHFAPGMDTDYNIKHEVAHAIDNKLNGVPKGDKLVNGQTVDTTREKVIDRMVRGLVIQRKDVPDGTNSIVSKNVVQLVLSKTVLNVVGEDHDESGARRVEEKQFCGIRTDSDNYWLENEFKARKITERESQEDIPSADPPSHRLDHIFYWIFIYANYLYGYLKEANVDKIKRTCRLIPDYHYNGLKLINEDKKFLEASDETVGQWARALIKLNDDNDGLPFLEKIKLEVINADGSEKAESEINKDKLRNWAGTNEYKNFLKLVEQLVQIDELIRRYQGATGKNISDKISMVRSSEMHKAATQQFETKGVWKVGDQHVQDIRKMLRGSAFSRGKETNYNLMSKDGFNEEFNAR